MNYFFDTEFIDDGKTIELISIGIVSEDGRELYRENADCDLSRACPWVQENVIKHLVGTPEILAPKTQIAEDVRNFVKGPNPRFWAYFASYDWVVLSQLYGRMIDMPAGWPMLPHDLKNLATYKNVFTKPEQTGTEHNALEDARWNKVYYDHIKEEWFKKVDAANGDFEKLQDLMLTK